MVRHLAVSGVVLAIALGAFARPAAAQDGSPFAVAAGWSWNQGDTPRDDQLIAGIRYTFPAAVRRNTAWELSADWLRVDSESVVGIPATRRRVSLIPVLLNYKQGLGDSLYGFVGAGARWAEKDVPEMDISDRWGFVWQLGLGYNFSRNLFVEGRWIAGTHPSDDGIIAAQVGLRF